MSKQEMVAGSPSDEEKPPLGQTRRPSAGEGGIPVNFREEDFLTRNGLNLKSFQRREFCPGTSTRSLLTAHQVTMALALASSTDR
jgi:hypothetical protein